MKLQSMLLPTGEFVLIASEATRPVHPDGLAEFREKSGAAAMLFTNEPVEVENAFVDENAVRADERVVSYWQEDEVPDEEDDPVSHLSLVQPNGVGPGPDADLEGVVTEADIALPEGFKTDITAERQKSLGELHDETLRLLEAGAGVSPAGLVKLTDEQKAARQGVLDFSGGAE
jgi:hypothetical protein